MIEKMKKYDFLIYHKDYQDFLLKLRDLGVVHVTQKKDGVILEDERLMGFIELEKRYADVICRLNRIAKEAKTEMLTPADRSITGTALLEKVETLLNEKVALQIEQQTIRKELERIAPLDDFDPESVERFNSRGWFIHFHAVSCSKFDLKWMADYNAIIFKKIGTQFYFATFYKEENTPPIEAEHIALPKKSAALLREELAEAQRKFGEVCKEIRQMACENLETLRFLHTSVANEINFEKVELSGDKAAGERLMVLEGYVPAKEEENTNAMLSQEAIYYAISDPTIKDNAPIKYKNNRFARTFEMISDMYDRPNYNAFDLTPFYAPFYIVFFGLCLGDCGYGLLLLIAAAILKKVAQTDFMKSAGNLAVYLGIGTTIFGFVSGSFFGVELPALTWSWFEPLKKIMIDRDQLFYISLGLGALQITYALVIKTITRWMRFGALYAMDSLGWLITIWGNVIVFATGEAAITPELREMLHILISSVGGAMMLLFNSPEKGWRGLPASIGSGLYGLFNKFVNLLGDMLSYIRLFALGISGAVMGSVFNELAIGFAPDIIILRELVIIVVFLFGHGINLFLNGLGAFIHPLRLTFVEFYNNAGFEGGGRAYEPFRRVEN